MSVLCDDLIAAGKHHNLRRIEMAIESIGRTSTRWPTPAEVLETIRVTHTDDVVYHQKLPAPEKSAEQLEKIQSMINAARSKLR